MKTLMKSFLALLLIQPVIAAEKSGPQIQQPGEIVFREIRYDARVSEDEARIAAEFILESSTKAETVTTLFDGELALLPTKLPDGLRIEREGNVYQLVTAREGKHRFKIEVVAKITRAEPWNQISFRGPLAAIASVNAQSTGAGVDLQMLTGTVLESTQTNNLTTVRGFLGAENQLSLRWQSRAAEVARKAVVAADSTVTAQITPTVIKFSSQFRYDVIQGKLPKLSIALPGTHALTRLVGEQIRDWTISTEGERQILTVEFIRAVEKNYSLTVLSEQTVETTPVTVSLVPPQPLDAERESGIFTVSAEDMQAEIESASGLRQINALAGSLAAYRFNARPLALTLRLKRIEPVVNASDRATIRLEETRLLANHSVTLSVEKAGIYQVEMIPQSGFVVAEVRGEGVDDWRVSDGKLRINFTNRVLGQRRLEIQLEQALKKFPECIAVEALRVVGAVKEIAQIGAASAAGIQLKTSELLGLREIPVSRLASRSDELLAYIADSAEWKLSLVSERLSARVVAEIFNLVTIGDGLVGGSATIRYGIINQGVQEFRVSVPAHWKNVEFTGPNIRRKESAARAPSTDTNSVEWTVGLQDKAWGAYTLVVTYDYQFDPLGGTLPVGGIHALDVERETGSIAITTAASLKLNAKPATETLRRVDEAELASVDRTIITRSVLLAYQYTGADYDLEVDVKRYEETSVLSAVADRTQLTSVLTDSGELLTQASFMVKNNDKQSQRFLLPGEAKFWGCYVNGQPAKPERDGDWLLVSLPRGADRDQAFAVDIVYAEKKVALQSGSKKLQLHAPRTDVPNTYAEWQLYVPTASRLSSFAGSMNVAQGTDYAVLDAWKNFLSFYGKVLREIGPGIILFGLLATLVIALVVIAARRGSGGLFTALAVLAIMAILGSMLLPALGKAKAKAQRISTINNLKQVGLAARIFAGDNDSRFPVSFEEMINELNTDKVTYDVESGQRFTYLGAGFKEDEITPDSILAYSPITRGVCSVLFADGSVQSVSAMKFAEFAQRGLIVRVPTEQFAKNEQERMIRAKQFANSPASVASDRIDGQELYALGAGSVVSGSGGGGIGKGQIVEPVTTPVPTTATVAAAPARVAGLRSIRIEIPRAGNSFLFTKILNVRDEPLSVSANIMSLQTFQKRQMMGQVAAFLLGLVVWLWQWRTRRNTFLLTLALALMIGSVSSLLIAWRALHDALIVGFPIVLLAVVSAMIWKFWRRKTLNAEESDDDASSETQTPSAIAGLLLIASLTFGSFNSNATEAVVPSASALVNVSILSASYTGAVNDRVAQLDAVIKVNAARAGQKITLFGDDVAVQDFSAKPADAKIVREGKTVSVCLPRKGETVLHLKLLVRLGGDVTKRQLSFAIPAALTSRMSLTIDQSDADVEFPGAISFKRINETQRTRLEALIGAGNHVSLAWTPRVKRAAEVAATVMAQNSALVSLGGGVIGVRCVFDYQVTQGELRSARIKIPAGHRLLRVEGESIRTWTAKEESGDQILTVELLKGMTPAYRLTVETEKPLDALPLVAKIETPHALDVKRETGMVALRADDELEYAVTRTDELQRVDIAAFAATPVAQSMTGIASAFRFLKPEFTLETRVAALLPQIEAVVRNHIRVADEQLSVSCHVDYVIKRVGVFALKLSVPKGYRVESVTGEKVLQWSFSRDLGIVEVTLKERVAGTHSLRLELVKAANVSPSIALAGVEPIGMNKLSGFVSVSAEPGVSVKTASFEGLTEIPIGLLPGGNSQGTGNGLLAFKFIAAETGVAAPWKLSVNTEPIEPWVRAEVASLLTVSDTLVTGHSQIRYDIQNAPVKELRLRIPAALKNVEITGANIRRRDHTGEVWRVELQNKVRGAHILTVTWDQSRSGHNGVCDLVGLSVEAVERET